MEPSGCNRWQRVPMEGAYARQGRCRAAPSSRSITAQRRQANQIVVPKVSGRRRRAADGQQPVSVTTGECARKPWRIVTGDSGIDGH
jgi:hypothetical protein